MLTKFKLNRSGEILVSRANSTHEQLKFANDGQKNRRNLIYSNNSQVPQATCLGEILTELEFINRAQLKRGLNWQVVLRKMTMALALCAPLMGAGQANAQTKSALKIVGIPTTVQAEDFSYALGVKTETTTDSGGGSNLGAIDTGNVIKYLNHSVNIPTTGEYIVSYRVSSLHGGGSFLFNNVGGSITKIDRVVVPKTGGWQTWVTVQRRITLKSGPHRFSIMPVVGGFNINWFRITTAASTIPKPGSSAGVSSTANNTNGGTVSSRASSVSVIKSSAATSSKRSSVASSAASMSKVSSKSSALSSKSSSKSSSKVSSSSKSSSSLAAGYTHVDGPVGLSWIAPKQREDRSLLDITELGGYQLRYKSTTDTKYTYVIINDPWTTTHNFSWLEGDYIFQVAAFDRLGMLSDFSDFINK
jgi:hypothetical protein